MSINLSPLTTAVIYADNSPYHQLQKKLYDIDLDYFEKIPAWTERIPSKLDFKLKSEIVSDFNKQADQLLNQELKSRLIQELGSITVTEKEVERCFQIPERHGTDISQ